MRALAWWRLVQLEGERGPAYVTVPDELHDSLRPAGRSPGRRWR